MVGDGGKGPDGVVRVYMGVGYVCGRGHGWGARVGGAGAGAGAEAPCRACAHGHQVRRSETRPHHHLTVRSDLPPVYPSTTHVQMPRQTRVHRMVDQLVKSTQYVTLIREEDLVKREKDGFRASGLEVVRILTNAESGSPGADEELLTFFDGWADGMATLEVSPSLVTPHPLARPSQNPSASPARARQVLVRCACSFPSPSPSLPHPTPPHPTHSPTRPHAHAPAYPPVSASPRDSVLMRHGLRRYPRFQQEALR